MSGSEFHVHGAHEHEMEHASHSGGSSSLAVAKAILATVGAVFFYMGGYTQANAALSKNDAAIKKTEAANQWNFYQAKFGRASGNDRISRLRISRKLDWNVRVHMLGQRVEIDSLQFFPHARYDCLTFYRHREI